MDNRSLGMIREYQHYHYENRYSMVDLKDYPDYSLIAKAYGIPFIRLKKDSEVEEGIKEALKTDGPCFIEANIDADAFTVG